jgi:feruloyl-CoA hydratase/lyase
MTHALIEHSLDGGVLTLTFLPQPATGVQINFVETLVQILEALPQQTDVRTVVLDGHLDLNLDLQHWQDLRQAQPVRTHRALQNIQRWRTLQLKTLPQAIMVVITGRCSGAALALVEGCDLALCSDDAILSLSEDQARWLGPETEAAFAETAQSYSQSLLHALRGQRLMAPKAQDDGWVTFTLPKQALASKVTELTQSLSEKDPLALQLTKETLAHVPHMDWDTSVNYTAAKWAEIQAKQAQAPGPSSRTTAIAGFLAGQSKPGLQG